MALRVRFAEMSDLVAIRDFGRRIVVAFYESIGLPKYGEAQVTQSYQKNGIVATGSGTAVQVLNNTVTGRGHINTIAQNGIVILSGATALIKGNTVTANWYTPTSTVACGLLFIGASGVKQQANSLSDNEVNLCNVGRGGGNTSS
jgi:hypothetical protein